MVIVNDRSMKLARFHHDRFRIVQGSVSSNQIQSRSRSDQLNNEIFKRATVISQKLTEELWEQDFKLILLKRTYSSFNFTILYHKSRMIWCIWYVINGILYTIVSNWFPLGEKIQRPKEYLNTKKSYSAIFTHIFLFMSIVLFIDLFQTHFCHFGFNRNYEQSMNLPFLIEPYLSDHSIKRLCVLTIQYAAIC